MTSYVAVVRGPYGGGSYYRHTDKDKAAKGAVRVFRQDWKHLLGDIKKGSDVPVNIYDCTDKTVLIGEDGVFVKGEDGRRGEQIARLELMHVTV